MSQWIAQARLHRGVPLSLLGAWQAVCEDLTQVMALASDPGGAQEEQTMQVWMHLLDTLEPLTDQDPDPRQFKLAALVYASRAQLFARKAEYSRTIADWDRALKLDPICAEAFALRGAASSHLGSMDRAAADGSKAIELAGWPIHYYQRARKMARGCGPLEEMECCSSRHGPDALPTLLAFAPADMSGCASGRVTPGASFQRGACDG